MSLLIVVSEVVSEEIGLKILLSQQKNFYRCENATRLKKWLRSSIKLFKSLSLKHRVSLQVPDCEKNRESFSLQDDKFFNNVFKVQKFRAEKFVKHFLKHSRLDLTSI